MKSCATRTFSVTNIVRCALFIVMSGTAGVASSQARLAPTVVAEGLENPWALAFIENGNMLVTERPGRLRVVSAEGGVGAALAGLPAISVGGQGGLLDLVTDREYGANRQLYFCYSEPDPENPTSRANSTALAKARLSDDRTQLEDVQVLFRQMPKIASTLHFGCRIIQLEDGSLLLGLGDRYGQMQQAQNLENHIGKVVRVFPDGSVPLNNPMFDGQSHAPEIWSYGHRNIQGGVMADDGTVWIHEHGPQGGDEVNRIRPGLNYGWPVITYGENYGGGRIGQGITQAPGMEQPVLQWTPSIAPSGMAEITSDRYGADWKGNLIVGSLKFRNLHRLQVQGDSLVPASVELPDLKQRVRDVRQGPDGLLYILTDQADGQLIRLDPVQ
ncbi:PQQ-dependent sugar dehydrogenase [Orrella marina]